MVSARTVKASDRTPRMAGTRIRRSVPTVRSACQAGRMRLFLHADDHQAAGFEELARQRAATETLVAAAGEPEESFEVVQVVDGVRIGHPVVLVVRGQRGVVKAGGAGREPGRDEADQARAEHPGHAEEYVVPDRQAGLDDFALPAEITIRPDLVALGGPGRTVPSRVEEDQSPVFQHPAHLFESQLGHLHVLGHPDRQNRVEIVIAERQVGGRALYERLVEIAAGAGGNVQAYVILDGVLQQAAACADLRASAAFPVRTEIQTRQRSRERGPQWRFAALCARMDRPPALRRFSRSSCRRKPASSDRAASCACAEGGGQRGRESEERPKRPARGKRTPPLTPGTGPVPSPRTRLLPATSPRGL